jgi:hypothetical protein
MVSRRQAVDGGGRAILAKKSILISPSRWRLIVFHHPFWMARIQLNIGEAAMATFQEYLFPSLGFVTSV